MYAIDVGNCHSVLGMRSWVVGSQGEHKGSPINTDVRREARAGGARATARDRPSSTTHRLAVALEEGLKFAPMGQASRPNIFVGGYATRSSRGDGVAYPPANI